MFFCPNCSNTFDITNKLKTQQKGGAQPNIQDIITKALENKLLSDAETENLTLSVLTESDAYNKLKNKDKEYVYNKLIDVIQKNPKHQDIKEHHAYFICTNCGLSEEIKEKTRIFSRSSLEVSKNYATSNIKNMLYSDILPRTRKYTCPNDKCESHKNMDKREAIFFRMNNTYQIKYICVACETSFTL